MYRFTILAIGADKDEWVTGGIAHFQKLVSRYAELDYKPLATAKIASSLSPAQIKEAEAALIRRQITPGDAIVALAIEGKSFDSPSFANWIDKTAARTQKRLVFVIGGPYGLDQSVLAGAAAVISFSEMTMSHQVVRLVLLEQLYRACSILGGSDYHK